MSPLSGQPIGTRTPFSMSLSNLERFFLFRSMDVASEERLVLEDAKAYGLNQCPPTWKTFFLGILKEAQFFKESLEIDLIAFSCLSTLALLQPAGRKT